MSSGHHHIKALKDGLHALTSKFKPKPSPDSDPIDTQATSLAVAADSSDPALAAHDATDGLQLHKDEEKTVAANVNATEGPQLYEDEGKTVATNANATDGPQLHKDEEKTVATNVDIPDWKLTLDEYCQETLPLLSNSNAQWAVYECPFVHKSVESALKHAIGHVIDFEDRDDYDCNKHSPSEEDGNVEGHSRPSPSRNVPV
jgi:hypothetical protein